ncbi:MAG: hypothetical protein IK104_10045 [Clostridia bacterium]|nr:hypothetical protein [Clostridia bacterium]
MRRNNLQTVLLSILLIVCLFCACSPGITGVATESGKAVTAPDGALLSEPSFVDFPVTRVHYERLSEQGQQAYRMIYNAVFSHPVKIAVPPVTLEELKVVVTALKDDNPHLLCLKNQFSYQQNGGTSYFIPKYTCSAPECEKRTEALLAAARDLRASTDALPDAYEKELFIHDLICESVEYTEADDSTNAYGALVGKKAVCEGYAYAAKLVCDMARVPCCVLRGTVVSADGAEEGHMWNAARLGGAWYHLDLTWDDPVSERENNVQHAYFNVPTAMVEADHKDFILPEGLTFGTSDAETYYRREKLVCAEDNWRDTVERTLSDVLQNGGGSAEFRFDSLDTLNDAVYDLFDAGGVYSLEIPAEKIALGDVTYSPDERTLVLRIFISAA